MFSDGSIAVALVKNQVMLVQASRTHAKREKFLDVRTYAPFGEGVFLATSVPAARIASSDLLTVLPPSEISSLMGEQGMLELPKNSKAFSQYMQLSSRHQKKYESLWSAWIARH
ncbi:hypothetical protein D9613_006713 [Agrocybe pediades]|uniref:Uncharacterized protein n=1 Tax=Agrocybe pediades TaxID=84607 RepID=A0A8H4VHV4_9AGAR|nr:hypothetical protein D9613_006713 [Agrocybe pediades]